MNGAPEAYRCRCLGPCPRCGWVDDDPEASHPEDGEAVCMRCRPLWSATWWAHVGPYGDGRHPSSAAEERAWAAYDADLMARGR